MEARIALRTHQHFRLRASRGALCQPHVMHGEEELPPRVFGFSAWRGVQAEPHLPISFYARANRLGMMTVPLR